ncbi:MAG TPA: hypothetical protein VK616_01835 [Flavitalea sp.]|nr:hypothetical protein [Flavitalea sp.]HTF29358.1 hypothetical protein [Flavitalea sp.]
MSDNEVGISNRIAELAAQFQNPIFYEKPKMTVNIRLPLNGGHSHL